MTHSDAALLLQVARRLDLDWSLNWYLEGNESHYYVCAGHGLNAIRIYTLADGIRLAAQYAPFDEDE